MKQGLGVVLSGALDRQGSGYSVSVKAAQTVTGNVLAECEGEGLEQGTDRGRRRRSW